MRRYETIAIIDPDISEDDRTSLLTRIKEIIPQQDGVVVQEDLWGARKLAYPIKKKPRGYYARYDYCGMGKAVEEVERFFRIDDRVLKYLTVLLNPDADVEKIQAEIAEAQAASAPSVATPTATPPATPPATPTATPPATPTATPTATPPATPTATPPAEQTAAATTAEPATESSTEVAAESVVEPVTEPVAEAESPEPADDTATAQATTDETPTDNSEKE